MPAVKLKVQLVAKTQFIPPDDVPWETDTDGGNALVEFGGRACYRSWSKPNPATATNEGYLKHIMDVGHFSVYEHGVVTFWLTGVSRSLTLELIRHRHFSYSQESQRYVPIRDLNVVVPDVIAAEPEILSAFEEACENAGEAYKLLLEDLERSLAHLAEGTSKKKQARQAARSVLPNAAETRILVTGNYRAFRHFIALRATEHADVEIRALAVRFLELLQAEPGVRNAFSDFTVAELEDGTRGASTPNTAR